MLFELETAKPLETIEKDLHEAAARHKFGVLAVHDLQQKMLDKGIEMERQVRIYEVCNPRQAKEVLDANPQISTALPCRISVYSDGPVYKLCTMRPTEMMKAFGEETVASVAQSVEEALIAIMREAAA
ncbi:MAG: DUF302 domain-containing protein [Acidobacteria bacterium]|nr:DUF302 domain-containing protein [Acidobacteriota bacterium]